MTATEIDVNAFIVKTYPLEMCNRVNILAEGTISFGQMAHSGFFLSETSRLPVVDAEITLPSILTLLTDL